MKYKLFTMLAVSALLTSNMAFAESNHHQDEMKGVKSGMMMSGDMPMMDMDKMHQHMSETQHVMRKMHDAKKPMEQQKLMHQHMKKMYQGMGMMSGMMSGSKQDKMPGKA